MRYAGRNGYYWSATTYPNATNAHYLEFNSTNVLPSYYNHRFSGFSVRGIVFFFPFFLFLLSSFSYFSLPYIIFLTVDRFSSKESKTVQPKRISSSDNVWEGEGRREKKNKK